MPAQPRELAARIAAETAALGGGGRRTPASRRSELKQLHVGFYGAVMGLAGLGLTARAAAPLFPGAVRAPAYFTELWVLLGAAGLARPGPCLSASSCRSIPRRCSETSPIRRTGLLRRAAGGHVAGRGRRRRPIAPSLGSVLWWIGFALLARAPGLGAGALALGRHRARAGQRRLADPVRRRHRAARAGASRSATPRRRASASACRRAAAPVLMALLFYRAVAGAAAARGAAAELVHPARAAVADLRERRRALPGRRVPREAAISSPWCWPSALLVYARGFARWPFGAALVGLYLPARRAGLRRRALRAGAPFGAVGVGRRRGAGCWRRCPWCLSCGERFAALHRGGGELGLRLVAADDEHQQVLLSAARRR